MRPTLSTGSSSRTAGDLSRAAIACALLGAAIFAAGCPRIWNRKNASAAQQPPSQQAAEAAEAASASTEALGAVNQASYSTVYCSGFIRDHRVPTELAIITGEQSDYKFIFDRGDYVYINRGSQKGVQVGDRFMVVRQESDPSPQVEWFYGQDRLVGAMGTRYRDLGHLRVVNVQPKVAIAEVSFSCDYMQRGDLVRPFEERPQPPVKDGPFDHFAPVSGKPVGMIVQAHDWEQNPARGAIVYVNLGAAQGVKIGDYLRVFRYEGKWNEYVPVTRGYQFELYGFGSSPERYSWKDMPREVLGEGVVLNATRNAATMLITYSYSSIYTGDEVEIE